ncbi:TPA_asm: TRZ/ATZ family protein [Salmonella enterica subsp. enterica serovar Typhimurium]|uniref:TRZ/ATZ family protein n=1 Tax=Salmonella typhimurium TaxID=90371 RepID=A0A707LKK4_SALTM|nr:FumA C-terminus/TtdB family hydratase beta subunit [Salmonella enterica]EIS1590269.1 fumarate hydratase C-terminal domain-containing protein [Salmonella enterica subsp. enterica serovar Kingston]HAC9882875.1 TRZ/ATZ family protein [Salmonella enterica subsp. enterica serovar Typhimurium]EBC6184682.1 TRZ/ATZ family protein [Salmonella enterica]EIX7496159.1 fumarate hydratase C-terminal domain-containing protein [Salmonella enterica]CDG06897.1 putative hydro-lyase [Salmonella enterica subsp. 
MMELTLPLTKEKAKTLKVGDILFLTGFAYTCRDAAHKKIEVALSNGEKSPVDFQNQTIYYAGPCPTRPGLPIGSNGPTTAARMDPFVEMMFQQGATAFLGKGDRADYVAELCKKYGGVSLLGIGGASAINTKHVKSVEIVAYEELGTESIKKLYFDRYRVIVGIDSEGNTLQKQEVPKYAK